MITSEIRRNLCEQLVERLQHHIVTQKLQPGDRLPTEIELAKQFGVGRQSVREAIKVLENAGIVETRPHHGSRLKALDTRRLSNHLRFLFELDAVSIKETVFVRRILECGAIPLVIEHADENDFQQMEAAIERMKALTQRGETFAAADMTFHQALICATKNRILQGFGGMLQEFFAGLQGRVHFHEKEQWQSIAEHEQIYAALKNRDAVAAQRVMEQHLGTYAHYPASEADRDGLPAAR